MYYPPQMLRRASLDDLEQSTCDLAPQLEHRIVMIQNEEVRERVNISEKFHKLIPALSYFTASSSAAVQEGDAHYELNNHRSRGRVKFFSYFSFFACIYS